MRKNNQIVHGYLQLLEDGNISGEYGYYLAKAMKTSREESEILELAKKLREVEKTDWADE